ncbi:amidohydrolase family protein [Pelagerythrobacter marensis]|uniref:Amidohydrolase family protein n=1 Tax=Pelagerythrobacter marensis TaxID=543877 RepID=A0A0G3X821_9SPHN|nr:amidohydrolase family protein [Pelagerythrobacter marensis]AKM06771.1 Amidohydrolase family protein [Pelagerythrobacter marensis]
MIRTGRLLAMLVACLALAAPAWPDAPPSATRTAIVGAAVIDGTGAPPRSDMVVVIEGERISAVSPRKDFVPSAGMKIIDGAGKTIVPGFVGMHDHTHVPGNTFTGNVAASLWIAGGVTTVMTAGSAEPERELALAREIARGERIGPEIFASAPYISGPGGSPAMVSPANEAEARAFVRGWRKRGVRWFKLYRHTRPAIGAAVIDEAHRRGGRVTGHLCSITFAEAAAMGIDGIEHGLTSASDLVPDKQVGTCRSAVPLLDTLDLDSPDVARLIETLVAQGVTLTSTLPILEGRFAHRPQGDARSLALLTPAARERLAIRRRQLEADAAGTVWTPAVWQKVLAFERRFVAAGGTLLMGPDFGRHAVPGFGNQRGFELLVEAGFTVPEAVRIATLNGASALGIGHRVGRIAPGFEADLILIAGDPVRRPRDIRKVETVFVNGHAIAPAPLIEAARGRFGPQ